MRSLIILVMVGWFGGCLPAGARVLVGTEVLAAQGFQPLKGQRVGLLTNPSGVNREGVSTIDVLRQARGVKLVALFAPEHGLDGRARAGDYVASAKDPRTGLPVHSLYGPTRKPTPAMLNGLDALVYDLQDTGTRSYTYISTMGLAMEACAEAGVRFVVLDRPNPLGGVRVEGPPVRDGYRSFISEWNVPYVYGLTCGELARMINGEGWIKRPCRLTIVPLQGWKRTMVWEDTGLRWVPTSPNVPLDHSAFGYAALGLLGEMVGGSGLSIGGVINRPFECVVADWLDAGKLSRQMQGYGLKGVRFPSFTTRYRGKEYQGVRLQFTDPLNAPLVAINFYLLEAIRAVSKRDLLAEATRAGRNFSLFDKAIGSAGVRKALRGGTPVAELLRSWHGFETDFRKRRTQYLLYPEISPASPPVTPLPKSTRASPTPRGYLTVTVSRGDTVSKIARDLGVSVSDIAEANPGMDVSRIYVGQKIRIPRK